MNNKYIYTVFSNWSENRYAWFLFSIIMSTALFVSLSASFTYYYNSDEAWHYTNSLFPNLWDSLVYAHSQVTHPPLSHARTWLARTILDEVWFIRLLGVVCYIGSGFCAFYLGQLIHSPLCGAIMAGLLMYATAIAEAAILVRGYSLLTFFLLLGLICYYRYIKDYSLRMLSFYSLSMSLAVLSEYLAIFIIFAYGVSFGLYQLYYRQDGWIKNLILWGVANSVILGCFLASYLTQGEVLTANVGWDLNGYFGNNHSFFSPLFRIILIPIESGVLNTLAYIFCFAILKKHLSYTSFNRFHIFLPFVLTIILSFTLDVLEIYPIWGYNTQLRFTTHVVVMYSLIFAYCISLCLPTLTPHYRSFAVLLLCIGSAWYIYDSRNYEEWSTYKKDVVAQIEIFKKLPNNSVILADGQGVYMASTFHTKWERLDSTKKNTYFGNTKLIAYTDTNISGVAWNPYLINRFMSDKTITGYSHRYLMISNYGISSCDREWYKKHTQLIFSSKSAQIRKIISPTPEPQKICS